MKSLLLCLLLLLGVTSITSAQVVSGRIPLAISGFVENKGQVLDQNRLANNSVRFIYADGASFNLQLKNDGFSYQLFKAVPKSLPEAGIYNFDPEVHDYTPSDMIAHRVDVKFVGASSVVKITAAKKSEAYFNFYTTGDATKPVLAVPSYYEVVYHNIYPNIDLVFSAPDDMENSQLKYEWIVREGGNPSMIKLQFQGHEGLMANADGSITVHTPVGTITEGQVSSYWLDESTAVASSYDLQGSTIGYKINVPVNKTLIIDPNIIWSVDYGGESNEFVSEGDLALDKKNNTYITGNTRSTSYMSTVGAHQTTFAGGDFDAFLAKLQTAGKLVWATYFGSDDKDEGHGLVADENLNIFMGGLTHSSTGMSTPGSHQPNFAGNTDAFLAKFTSSGVLQWSTYYGGKGDDQINAITADALGNIYFTGYTTSDSGISTPGAHQDTIHKAEIYGGDVFVGEFRNGGSLEWASYLGGPATDRGHGICVGNKKELYIQGTCESTSDFAVGAVQQTVFGGGPSDAFVAKWDTNGLFFWCSYYGGEGDDHGRGVAVDQQNNIYIIGWTDSDSAMSTPNGVNQSWYEGYSNFGDPLPDGYLAKFTANGIRVWGSYFGGEARDQFKGLTVDKTTSSVYAIGYSSSEENISTPGAFQETLGGSADGFLVKANYDGTLDWASYIGDTASDKFHDIEKDAAGYLYCLMEVDGKFPLTPGTNLLNYRGETDAVVVRFSPFDACYDPYEPNETTQSGKKINAYKDSTLYGYTASISSSVDKDFYKIKITPGNNMKVVLTDLPADYNMNLYNSVGQLVKTSANTGTEDEVIIYNSITAGNYTLEISHSAAAYDPNNCYRMKLMLKTSAWFTREGDEESTMAMGSSALSAYAEIASGSINLNVSSAFDTDADIILTNAFGQQLYRIKENLAVGTQYFSIPAGQLPSGIYYIRILTATNHDEVMKVANLR